MGWVLFSSCRYPFWFLTSLTNSVMTRFSLPLPFTSLCHSLSLITAVSEQFERPSQAGRDVHFHLPWKVGRSVCLPEDAAVLEKTHECARCLDHSMDKRHNQWFSRLEVIRFFYSFF